MLDDRHQGLVVEGPSRGLGVVSRPLLLTVALALAAVPALAQGTPPQPSAAQPSVPQPSAPNPTVVQTIVGPGQPTLNVRKARRIAGRHHVAARHHLARRLGDPGDIDRPALAGVELLRPLPPPGQPPHFVVPTPAYPFENFVTAYTTPPPPLFCHGTRREPDLSDPRLYRERAVICEPDNP